MFSLIRQSATRLLRMACLLFTSSLLLHACVYGQDRLLADFESETYGEWVATGKAFGPGPASGTLPNQMHVSRYQGQRLVNSFFSGDGTVGTLTSPTFEITHPHLNFLIGGGGYQDETCVRLLVDGKVVRTATGPNTAAGGSETLAWQSWDVTEFQGQQATIRIIDQATGGWGHILADHFVLSDQPRQATRLEDRLRVTSRYLHLPVKTGAPKVWMNLYEGNRRVRRFQIELADDEQDFVAAADISPWIGKELRIEIEQTDMGQSIFDRLSQSEQLTEDESAGDEPLRPSFHFTSRIGWLNDPNGLVYHNGTWHLFYQHNPFGWDWGNMHWGHATSEDLIHWTEQGEKIHPWSDAEGAAFSGSGLVDFSNSSGLGTSDNPPLVFPFTDTGAGESLAYSVDGGKTLKMFAKNPVVRHQGRDPKVIWHEPTKRWVMAVYDEHEGQQMIAFYSSKNLIDWNLESRINGFYECPDLFELKVEGHPEESYWVLYGADAKYMLGSFDGKIFTPSHEGKHQVWFGDFYAAQTYSDAPSNRRVQIGWGRGIQFPKHRFNQQMVVPVELTLKKTDQGPRMFAWPVKELENYTEAIEVDTPSSIAAEPTELFSLEPAWQLDIELQLGEAASAELNVGGTPIVVDRAGGKLSLAEIQSPLVVRDGVVSLRVLVDRGSIELFAGDGAVAISKAWRYGRRELPVTLKGKGDVAVQRLELSRIQ